MALHKNKLNTPFHLPECEKHFHDFDETWIITKGKGIGFWIDHEGNREEFELDAGDVWMIPAGYEHGSVDCNSQDFEIATFIGTRPPGSHEPKHYYVEEEEYIPTLQLVKIPTERYRKSPTLPNTMKAVVFAEQGRMTLEDHPLPELQPGQILCKTLLSGVTNGTERNALTGGNYGGRYPAQPGYQNVAEIVARKDTVSYQVGDIIFSGGHHKHVGYFAANVSDPEAAHNLILKLPEDLDRRWACLFGMASVAMHDVRRSGVGLGDKTLVIGAGSIGLFTAQIARAAGADVTICDLDSDRLDIARQVGITKTTWIEGDETWSHLKEAGPYNVVFEDSGAPILDKVIGPSWNEGLITHRGKIIVVAGRFDVSYNFNAGQSHEASLLHVSHFDRSDLIELCRLVTEGIVQCEPLIRDEVHIPEAKTIYNRLRDEPETLLGTILDWSGHP
ncbi:MAG: hypothetical protein CME21_20445 [Gemmatimonadetes bacterium]|jgi:2-desacetyl-2-hydroxyethyl bacteriochlorophyllide A dehydrogenase|nr:hypothetical protein [Gemmatimonadota bacterium]HCK09412.1 hypothetical protein [Candidatus Latescibacterota bacterium]